MSNLKHAPTPWAVSEKTIRYMGGEATWITPLFVNQNDDCLMTIPDAARIVSCVNALEGIESPEKLMESYLEMLEALKFVSGKTETDPAEGPELRARAAVVYRCATEPIQKAEELLK